jgi:hypothetical protein
MKEALHKAHQHLPKRCINVAQLQGVPVGSSLSLFYSSVDEGVTERGVRNYEARRETAQPAPSAEVNFAKLDLVFETPSFHLRKALLLRLPAVRVQPC